MAKSQIVEDGKKARMELRAETLRADGANPGLVSGWPGRGLDGQALQRVLFSGPADGSHGFAGDLSVEEAWAKLQEDPAAQLVDVRTQAEWSFVGVPDLSSAQRKPIFIEWQTFPAMDRNDQFLDHLAHAVAQSNLDKKAPVLFLCRSGARSKAAALAAADQGYTACYNVAGGFEGDKDGQAHRGRVNGWKAAGLPWSQS